MSDTSENRCDKISVLCRKDKFSTILAHYLLYVYIIRVSSIISWTRNLKQSRILTLLIPFVDREQKFSIPKTKKMKQKKFVFCRYSLNGECVERSSASLNCKNGVNYAHFQNSSESPQFHNLLKI